MALGTDLFLTLAAENPVDHVVNHPWIVTDNGVWIWSAQQTNLVLSGLIMIVLGPWLVRQIGTGPAAEGNERYITKNPFAHMIEVIAVYLRDEVVHPLLHERTARYMPFLWTLFFFILVNNLLGLMPLLDIYMLIKGGVVHTSPIGGTATQNLFVNAVLAAFAFVVINYAGIKELGLKGYLHHLTAGAPWYVWPLMIPIEILGMFIKPVALTIRLFANMTAGHILLATLFMFVGMSLSAGWMIGAPVTLLSAVGAIAIYFLETFVAFLQAFVFMFLTAVFIGQLSHHGEHSIDNDELHTETHGVTPLHASDAATA
ncbi:MAG: ATP synthase F0 subunit A [Phycisphaerae bacterium]|nr:ATP synthase F0 subunit A [Phycisphaerae bacterium]